MSRVEGEPQNNPDPGKSVLDGSLPRNYFNDPLSRFYNTGVYLSEAERAIAQQLYGAPEGEVIAPSPDFFKSWNGKEKPKIKKEE